MYSDKLIHFHTTDPLSRSPNPIREQINQQIDHFLTAGGKITQLGNESGLPRFGVKMKRREWVSSLGRDRFRRSEILKAERCRK
jgi:hypothetical protein